MFQIPEFTEAHLATITSRVEKHGDDEKAALSLGIEITASNFLLDTIDPTLREAMYKAVDDGSQEDLPGVPKATPVLRSNSIDRVSIPMKYEGWTMKIDSEVDEEAAMVFGLCKVDKASIEPKQGGSIVLRLRVGTSDIDAERSGWLTMHNGQSIWIALSPPEKKAEAIDGTTEAFAADHPDATDLFASDGARRPEDDEAFEALDQDAP